MTAADLKCYKALLVLVNALFFVRTHAFG